MWFCFRRSGSCGPTFEARAPLEAAPSATSARQSPARRPAQYAQTGQHQRIGLRLRNRQDLPADLATRELGGVEVDVGVAGKDVRQLRGQGRAVAFARIPLTADSPADP